MNTLEYKTSLDVSAKVVTGIVIILFVFIIYKSMHTILASPSAGFNPLIIIVLILLFTLLISYLFMPQKYILSADSLIIKRPVGRLTIRLHEITRVDRVSKAGLSGTIRTFGIGGLFGYVGKFYHRRYGKMTFYITNREKILLLFTSAGRIIGISPDDLNMYDTLLEYLKK